MFVFILIIFSFLCFRFIVRGYRDQLSKRFVWSYIGYWLISLSISLLNPYGLYPVSIETYLIMLLNVWAFVLGYSVIRIKKVNMFKGDKQSYLAASINHLCHNRYFLISILIGLYVCYWNYTQFSSYLSLVDEDRLEAVSHALSRSSSLQSFVTIFFLPAFYEILLIVFSYLLVYQRERRLLVLFFLFLLLYSLFGGGRQSFFNIVIAFYFLLFVSKELVHPISVRFRFPRWIYVMVLVLGVGSWVMMSWMTAARSGKVEWNWNNYLVGSEKLQSSFVTYSTLPFRLFDYGIHNEAKYLDAIGGYQFGLASLDGLNRYAYIILKRFGITIDLVTEKTTALLQDTWVHTAPDKVSNYAYTSAFYHYLDFGVLGILGFSLLFGMFVRTSIRQLYRMPSWSAYCLSFYLFYVALHSVFTWHLNKPFSLGFIIILSYLSYRRNHIRTPIKDRY